MIITGNICVCDQCGKRWLPEGSELPRRCSRCKSTKWNSKGATAAPQATAAPDPPAPEAPEPEPEPAHNKEPRPAIMRPPKPARKGKSKASRPKGRTKVQAISAPATQASQMTTRSQLSPTAHAVNCACYSCHTPDW